MARRSSASRLSNEYTEASVRIVAVADTHLFHHELVVPSGDVLVHAGDMCRGGSVEELIEALDWMASLPHETKIVVAGNHDTCLEETPEVARRAFDGRAILYLEDAGVEVRGLRVWGSPWQPEYNGWAFNLPRGAALAGKWSRIPEGLDLLVTHGPPRGIGDRSSVGEERSGCADLRVRVAAARPRVHLFGHIHEDGGAWDVDGTTFVNCTTWECERAPTVIDVDPQTGAVVVTAPPARR
jgi:predicted phosphohydrolase